MGHQGSAANKWKYEGSMADTRCKGCVGNIQQSNMPAKMERMLGTLLSSMRDKRRHLSMRTQVSSKSFRTEVILEILDCKHSKNG